MTLSQKATTTAPDRVRVELGARSYSIVIGRGLIDTVGVDIASLKPGASAMVVTDERVAALHLTKLEQGLAAAGIRTIREVVPAGERSKNFATLERVVEALLAARLGRGDLVLAFGGGMIGDLAGFAAAIALRGIDVVQIPTTLLAQVDAAIGGKTGIDTRFGKNLVGAFHQPRLVLADTALLDTLPEREFRAGYAEVVKYGLINDAAFFHWLEQNWRDVFAGSPARSHAIATSCRHKAAIVARDEREGGERALLNLGHTFAHALETATGFSDRLLHGEAVAIGITLAFRLSVRLKLCPENEASRVAIHLAAAGLPTRLAQVPGDLPSVDRLLELMAHDKKASGNELVFILARGIGQSFIAPKVDPAEVRALLSEESRRT